MQRILKEKPITGENQYQIKFFCNLARVACLSCRLPIVETEMTTFRSSTGKFFSAILSANHH